MSNITILNDLNGDWGAVYIDGDLVIEGNNFKSAWIRRLQGLTIDSVNYLRVDFSQIDETPLNLSAFAIQ